MKKAVLATFVLVVVLIGGGAWYLVNNLDALVKDTIETAGTDAVGSAVRVGSVSIDLKNGSASIRDFSIANPAGYSDVAMVSFGELSVALDLANLSTSEIGIKSIIARNPRVLYENANGGSNLETVADRFASEDATASTESASSTDIMISIGSIEIENIEAAISASILPKTVEASLGDIRLQNLRGTPDELADQIMKPVMSQLSRTAGNALLTATKELLGEDLKALGDQVKDQAQDKLDDAKENIREGLGNLLRRN